MGKFDSKYFFIIFATLISIRLWSFQLIEKSVYDIFSDLLILTFIFITLYNFKKLKTRTPKIFTVNVLLFLFLPFLSFFGAAIYHDQPVHLTLISSRALFYWLFYFILHIFNIPSEKIIKLMLIVGVGWIFLTIIQQFTYPTYFFYTRDEENDSSILRAGVYRFMLYRHQYGVFLLFYFFYKYLLSQKAKYLIPVGIGLIGLYYYGTRQFAIAAIACLLISVVYSKARAKLNALVFIFIGGAVVLIFSNSLFSEYIEMTNQQLESEDDVRIRCAEFFFFDYWPDNFSKLLGNGLPNANSAYGDEQSKITEILHFYRSDIGIIGAFSSFGIFHVLNIIWLNLRGLKRNLYQHDNLYLRLTFVNSLILLFISEYYFNTSAIPFYCFCLYLIDKSYAEKIANEQSVAKLEA